MVATGIVHTTIPLPAASLSAMDGGGLRYKQLRLGEMDRGFMALNTEEQRGGIFASAQSIDILYRTHTLEFDSWGVLVPSRFFFQMPRLKPRGE